MIIDDNSIGFNIRMITDLWLMIILSLKCRLRQIYKVFINEGCEEWKIGRLKFRMIYMRKKETDIISGGGFLLHRRVTFAIGQKDKQLHLLLYYVILK
jgi:hypothetical protein